MRSGTQGDTGAFLAPESRRVHKEAQVAFLLKLCGLWEETISGALGAGGLLPGSCLVSLGPADWL